MSVNCICRPAHDISLEEFDDEDLSEITDDCGIGLNYDSDPYEKVRFLIFKQHLNLFVKEYIFFVFTKYLIFFIHALKYDCFVVLC